MMGLPREGWAPGAAGETRVRSGRTQFELLCYRPYRLRAATVALANAEPPHLGAIREVGHPGTERISTMARKTPSRKELRKQAEAAESREAAEPKKKKAAAKKAAPRKKRTREKALQRKRLVWGVFSGSMKEEARFPYDQRDQAEEKINQLRQKSVKKMYFIQPIKEPIAEALPEPAEKAK